MRLLLFRNARYQTLRAGPPCGFIVPGGFPEARSATSLKAQCRGCIVDGMNPIDLLILVLVVGGGFLGWVNGVVKWLFTFLGLIVGVFVASRLYGTLDWAIPLVDSDGLRQFIVFILIVAAASIGGWMLGRAVKKALSILLMGWVDRGAGMALGLLVGLLAGSAVALAASTVPSDGVRQAVEESLLAATLLDATSFLRGLMPSEFDVKISLFGGAGRA